MKFPCFWIYLLLLANYIPASAQNDPPKPLAIKELNYIYSGIGLYDKGIPPIIESGWFGISRTIFALNDSIAKQMSTSLVKSINNHWQAEISNAQLLVESSGGGFREFPKFKPKLPKKYSDKAELFLRILDRTNGNTGNLLEFSGSLSGMYVFECKVLNGSDGSELFSRSMEWHLYRKPTPEGQYLLTSVPGMQLSFLEAFDEASRVFFSTNPPSLLKLEIEPACLFVDYATSARIKESIKFSYSIDKIFVSEGPELAWIPKEIDRQQIGKTKKQGYGVGSGIFTTLTGIDNEKERTKTNNYFTRVLIDDGTTASQYAFHIPIQETESETVSTTSVKNTDGSKSIDRDIGRANFSRMVLSGSFITRNNDTIGNFEFTNKPPTRQKASFLQYWNGKDSSTIAAMPNAWSARGAYPILSIAGELYGKPFLLSNTKGGNQLDVWYNEEQIGTFKVENYRPTEGVLYHNEAPHEVLKVLAMFTSLPYRYYGK